jgi:hypothetical protein
MPADRRALVVGVNSYQVPDNDLDGAVADAQEIADRLRRHEDETPNYDIRLLLDRMESGDPITRASLSQACQEVFSDFDGDVLVYFSGHGVLTNTGGYLCTFDAAPNDWGVKMDDIVLWASQSRARDILLILDCCHSGDIANPAMFQGRAGTDPLALLRENMTVIAASRPSQAAVEAGGHGLFTAAVLDALDGGAADHMGWVTAPAIYGYVERRFGAFDQRPVYKSHATRLNVVRHCAPLIERFKLYDLLEHFPHEGFRYPLDPEYEPEDEFGNVHEPVNEQKVAIAQLFKDYRDAGLLKTSTPGEQFYWVARRSHTVELTPRGREYWRLVKHQRI